MKLEVNDRAEPALLLQFSRRELPVFRALLERASFQDTRPELQAAVFDLLEQLLEQVPVDGMRGREREAPPER